MHRYLSPRFWRWAAWELAYEASLAPRNLLRDRRLRRDRVRGPLGPLTRYERRVYSQNGEDGILEAIFAVVGFTTRYAVEFGVGKDAVECNARRLIEREKFTGLFMDGWDHPPAHVRQEFVTAENVNALFQQYGVPDDFDLLSIDIDGVDYWVWQAIDPRYRPRVVALEYNAAEGPHRATTVPYAPDFRWDGTAYMGASLAALDTVSRAKGYTLVGCDRRGINAFWVRNDLAHHFQARSVAEHFRPARFGRYHAGHATSRRTMQPVAPPDATAARAPDLALTGPSPYSHRSPPR